MLVLKVVCHLVLWQCPFLPNYRVGSFLVPYLPYLIDKFNKFLSSHWNWPLIIWSRILILEISYENSFKKFKNHSGLGNQLAQLAWRHHKICTAVENNPNLRATHHPPFTRLPSGQGKHHVLATQSHPCQFYTPTQIPHKFTAASANCFHNINTSMPKYCI